jgi:hypothetical protein
MAVDRKGFISLTLADRLFSERATSAAVEIQSTAWP